MIGNNLTTTLDQRLSCSWRYVSPSRAQSQDFYEAFILRPNEPSLSFDVNSNVSENTDQKRVEIYRIYDKKPNFNVKSNGRFLMIDLANAQEEANFAGEQIHAVIDGVSHCSLFYTNGSYENETSRLEIISILYHNIGDVISISKNADNQIVICEEDK